MNSRFVVNIITRSSLTSTADGELFLRILGSTDQAIRPQRYGNYEPLKKSFDPSSIDSILESWQWPFLWKRKDPTIEGGAWQKIGPQAEHGWITISGSYRREYFSEILMLFKNLSKSFDADFSLLTLLTGEELLTGIQNGTATIMGSKKQPYFGVSPKKIHNFLPDLYWATIFGPSYISHFGRERILATPSSLIEAIDRTHLYLQLSDSLEDIENSHKDFYNTRHEAKLHLDKNSFFDLKKGSDCVYNTPNFKL